MIPKSTVEIAILMNVTHQYRTAMLVYVTADKEILIERLRNHTCTRTCGKMDMKSKFQFFAQLRLFRLCNIIFIRKC